MRVVIRFWSDDAEMRSMVIHHRWRFCNAQQRQRACSK